MAAEKTVTRPPAAADAAAIESRLTAAARTRPRLWSVWLPISSVRPGTLKSPTADGENIPLCVSSRLS